MVQIELTEDQEEYQLIIALYARIGNEDHKDSTFLRGIDDKAWSYSF